MPHPKSALYTEVLRQTSDKKRRSSPRQRKRREESSDHQKEYSYNDRQHSDHRTPPWEASTTKSKPCVGDCRTVGREANNTPTQTDPIIIPSFMIGNTPRCTSMEEHLQSKSRQALASGSCHDRVQSDSQLLRKSQTDTGRPGVIHLSHDKFSVIADQLVSKMKQELLFDDSAPYRPDSPTNCAWDKMSESSPSEFCSAPEDASDDDTKSVSQTSYIVPGMLSHYCVICASHMVPPANAPMLLIPCGHTVCKTCTASHQFCPVCRCGVMSTTFNVLLQQIVIDYTRQQETDAKVEESDSRRARDAGTQSEVPTGKGHTLRRRQPLVVSSEGGTVGTRKSPREHERRRLALNARRETLEAEAVGIRALNKELDREMEVFADRLRCLDERETSLLEQIDELTVKVATTRQERDAIRQKMLALGDEQTTEKMRLDVIRERVTELRKEEEKMGLLAHVTSSCI